MTKAEKVLAAVSAGNIGDNLVALAYYMGREAAAREICDAHRAAFDRAAERAENCRYKHMAAAVLGEERKIYTGDYAGTITAEFGGDAAAEK